MTEQERNESLKPFYDLRELFRVFEAETYSAIDTRPYAEHLIPKVKRLARKLPAQPKRRNRT